MKAIILFCIIGFVNCEDIFGGDDENPTSPQPSTPLASTAPPTLPQTSLKVINGTTEQKAKLILQTQPPLPLQLGPLQLGPLSPSDSDIEQLQLQAESSNDLAHRLIKTCPQTTCIGLDCVFVVVNGCRTCVCPIGSPARGCDRLPENFWQELMTSGCPNGDGQRSPPKRVIRWYRFTDEERGISECRYYMFPMCNDDFNFWRSPRTKAECQFYCFSQGGEIEPVTQVSL